uniref:Secreted protein n=1 Tax=Macrostomum lignano TaxID=282301 RepID=A0A1I8J2W6_9PLAT
MISLRLAVAVSAIALGLLPLPSEQQQPPRQFDPMFNPACPKPAGDCGRGRSLVATRDVPSNCCPSCNAYSSSATCDSTCAKLNLSATPCFSSCGDAGCARSLCGEPLNGGNSCCNATKIFGCPIDKIFLDSDCCPDCNHGSSANPPSPSQCRFNQTRGVGQPQCDSFGSCKLKPVKDRRDDSHFSYDLIKRVCTESDLDLLMQRLTFSQGAMTGAPTGSGGSMLSGALSLSNMTTTQLKAYLEQFGALLNNMTRLPEVVKLITSPTCRAPIACIAQMYNQSARAIKALLDPILASSAPDVTAVAGFMIEMGAKMTGLMTKGKACMAKVQWQTPCVAKVQAINMEELLQRCRCNRSSPFEFGLLTRIAGRVANKTGGNQPPGLDLLEGLTCPELRNPCAVDFLNALIDRIGSGCTNAQLLQMARERVRNQLMRCTGGGLASQMTHEDMANALANCQLNGEDIKRLAREAPTKLQQVLLNNTAVPSSAVPTGAGQSTLGAMVQERLRGCPDLKAAVDRAVAQNLDPTKMSASNVREMIRVIKPDIISRVQETVWSGMSAAEIATMSKRLKDDPDREAKCQELVPRVNAALLANLKACIDKISPERLKTLFSSPADLKVAAQAFNFTKMSPRDIARSTSTLRDMLKSVTATSANCLTYMNSLFSFPRNRIDAGLCRNDTCFKQMCSIMPDHPNTVFCQEQRPPPTASSMSTLGVEVMTQLTQTSVRSALSGTTDKASFQTLLAKFSGSGSGSSGSSSSAKSGIAQRIIAKKLRSTIGAVVDEFQKTFLQGAGLSSFSASDTDASLLCQLNSEQLRRLPCSEMSMVAYKAKTYLSNVDSGAGNVVSECVCQSFANCGNITSTALSDIGGFAMFISPANLRRLPASVRPVYCQAIQAVDAYEKSTKLSMAHQRLIHEICAPHTDMSGSGGSNNTNLDSLASWNSTVVSAIMPCVLTTAQIGKLDLSAAEYIIPRLPQCPPNNTYLRSICNKYFQLYNDGATSGNYSTSMVRMCFAFIDTLGNMSKVNRDDVRTESGTVATDAAQTNDSCAERASHGHTGDCDSAETTTYASTTSQAQRLMIRIIEGSVGTGSAAGRRRKRSASALTCNDIQNLASGVSQVTAAQIQAMSQTEFTNCFSTFGMADAAWSSDQCVQLKAKTEAAYNTTNYWTSSVLLTVGCLTQCWSSAEIAQIPYSDVAHISDIGKYCKLMPDMAKTYIMSAYIANAKGNDSSQMTRSELSSLGYLTCGALPVYVDRFNATNVLNAMTELGTPGPCSAEVVASYVNRLKASALGSTVASWQTSYFTSLSNLLGGLSNTDIPTLTTGQIGYIDASTIPGVSASKFKDFTTNQLSGFSASQKSAVTPGQLALLSDSQKQALGFSETSGAGWLSVNLLLLAAAAGVASAAGRWQPAI